MSGEGSGIVEICDPQRHLLVSLIEAGAAESHAMEVRFGVQGEEITFVVEERGIPREQLPAYGAGVQVHVEDLVSYLSGKERCDAQMRWKELFPAYESMPIDSV